jgi:hypothetical protein
LDLFDDGGHSGGASSSYRQARASFREPARGGASDAGSRSADHNHLLV